MDVITGVTCFLSFVSLWFWTYLSWLRYWHRGSRNNRQLESLQRRHNGRDGVSKSTASPVFTQPLFGRRSKKTSKLRVTGLCVGNSQGTGEFPAQMASNAENVSIRWRHHIHKELMIKPQHDNNEMETLSFWLNFLVSSNNDSLIEFPPHMSIHLLVQHYVTYLLLSGLGVFSLLPFNQFADDLVEGLISNSIYHPCAHLIKLS